MVEEEAKIGGSRSQERATAAFGAVGIVGALIALIVAFHHARNAAAQTWAPFVLVAGLLLIGLVAEEDRLFHAAGSPTSPTSPSWHRPVRGSDVFSRSRHGDTKS